MRVQLDLVAAVIASRMLAACRVELSPNEEWLGHAVSPRTKKLK
jgi:hypothetical protein